jgi:hypothetical protein
MEVSGDQINVLETAGGRLLRSHCLITTQASATIYDVTYVGTVTSGTDETGVFGIINNSGSVYVGVDVLPQRIRWLPLSARFHLV